jgi:predicted MFS family arabinose efflux permease
MSVHKATASGEEEKLLLPLRKWQIWYVMIVVFILLVADFMTRLAIAPLFPLIKKEFDISDAQLGLLSTIVLVTVTICAIPLSYLIDRWRRGKMISLMALVWSLASLASGLASNYATLFASRATLGVAEASYNSAGQTMIMATIKKKFRMTMSGLLFTGMTLGSALGLALGGVLGARYGWRTTLMMLAIPGVIFGILAWFMPDYKNPPRGEKGSAGDVRFGQTFKQLLKNKTLLFIIIAYSFIMFIQYMGVTWMPMYLIRYLNMDMATAGTIAGVMGLVGIVAMPIGGWIGDVVARKGPRNKIVVIWFSTLLIVVAYGMAVLLNYWPLFLVSNIGLCLTIPLQQVAIQEVVPVNQRASAFGLYYAGIFILGGLWSPYVIGAISDAINLQAGFLAGIGWCCIALFLYPFAYKFFNNDYNLARQQETDLTLS